MEIDMQTELKKELIDRIEDAESRLDLVSQGQNEIGNLTIALSQLVEVLKVVVPELSETTATAKMLDAVIGRML